MNILFPMIKIIGWTLLAILGLFLLLLMIFLFIPLRYKGEFEADNEFPLCKLHFKLHWLLGILRLDAGYLENDFHISFKIFGKSINLREKETATPANSKEASKDDVSLQKTRKTKSEPQKKKAIINNVSETIKRIKDIFSDQNNQKAFQITLNAIKYLCKHYGPRKLRANLTFSFGDPANTGVFLGIISVIPAIYSKGVLIKPDFISEKIYVEGTASFVGRIRMYHLVKVVAVCFIKKESRTVILKLINK